MFILRVINLVAGLVLFALLSLVQTVYATELQLKHDHHEHHDGCHVTDPKKECIFKPLALPANAFDDNSVGQEFTIYADQPNNNVPGFVWLAWHGDEGLPHFLSESASESSSDEYKNPYGGSDNTPKVNNWVYEAHLNDLESLTVAGEFGKRNLNRTINVPLWKTINTIDVPSSIASYSLLSWIYQQTCSMGVVNCSSRLIYKIAGYAQVDYLGSGYSGGDIRVYDAKGNLDKGKCDEARKKFWIKVRFKGFKHCFNTPPVAQNASFTTDENKAVATALAATDADGDALTYTVTAGPAHGTLSGTAPNLLYSPNLNFSGTDSFTYSVSDGVFSDTGKINITINHVNQAPVAQNVSATTNQNVATNVALSATDVDSPTLTYSIKTQPLHGALSGNGANWVYTPATNYYGSDSFTYAVSDGQLSATATASITINHVNQAPVAQNVSATTNQNVATNVALSATDVDSPTLTYSIKTQPLHGALSGNGANWVYTPATNYYGSDSFTYAVSDGQLSATATASITINHVNQAPVAQNVSATTNQNVATNITLSATDIDSPTLTYSIKIQPLHGTLSGSGTTWVYTPATNYYGSDSFTYAVSDGQLSATATANITINHVNQAPVAQNVSATANENASVNIPLLASDIDSPTLTYSITTQPQHGTLSGSGANWVYTPALNYYGSDTFTYSVSDGQLSATATANITVNHVNQAPVAQNVSATTNQNLATSITLHATDVDGDTLSYSVASQPSHGTLSGTGAVLTYTPANNYYGLDSFSYTVSDGSLTSTATVMLTVNHVNHPPVVSDIAAKTTTNKPVTLALAGSDADGDALQYALSQAPANGKVTISNNQAVYTPNPGYTGQDTFSYVANDGSAQSSPATATVTVASSSNGGNDFWFTFLPNYIYSRQIETLKVYVSSTVNTTATLEIQGLGYSQVVTVVANTPSVIDLSAVYKQQPFMVYQQFQNITSNAGIHIHSNDMIAVYALNAENLSSGMATIYPTNSLGTSYLQTGYDPGYDPAYAPTYTFPELAAIVATQDHTTVTIHPAHARSLFDATINKFISNTIPPAYGTPYTIILNKGQTYHLIPGSDVNFNLSGTTVDADKPIAFFSGDESSQAPAGTYGAEHFFEQSLSTDQWQREFLTAPSATRSTDLLRIYANSDDTLIYINHQLVSRIDRGAYYETELAAGSLIQANHPIWVNQFAQGSPNPNGFGFNIIEPSMRAVQSLSGFLSSYVISVPSDVFNLGYHQWAAPYSQNYIDIIANSLDTASVLLDGQPISVAWHDIVDTGYKYAQILFADSSTAQQHTVTADHPVGVSVYGFVDVDAYGYSAGSATFNTDMGLMLASLPVTLSTPENQPLNLDPLNTLAAGQSVTIVQQPSHGVIAQQNGLYVYTPAAYYHGVDQFQYNLMDSHGVVSVQTVSINIIPIYYPLQPQVINVTTNENATVQYQLPHVDVNGQVLTYLQLYPVTHGTQTPAYNHVDAIAINYSPVTYYVGTDSIPYQVSNGKETSTITVNFTVVSVPQQPIAASQSVSVAENAALPLPLTGYDPNGVAVTFAITTQTQHGTLTGTAPNLVYTPAAGFTGTDSFIYSVNNGTYTVSAMMNINVTPIPLAQSQAIDVNANGKRVVILQGSEVGNPTLTYQVLTQPTNGTLSGTAPNLVYTPNAGYLGADSFNYQVNDGRLTATGTVSLNVANLPPQQPVWTTTVPTTTVQVGQQYQYTFSAYDPSVGDITYSLSSNAPQGATLQGNLLTWTPTLSQAGAVSFDLIATSATGTTARQTFNLFVNIPPAISSTPGISGTQGRLYQYQIVATDPNNYALSYSITNAPAGMQIDANTGLVRWTSAMAGTYNLVVAVSDGHATATQTYTLTISPPQPLSATIQTVAKVNINTNFDANVVLTGAGSDAVVVLKVDGSPVSVDANYHAVLSFTAYGSHTLSATVTEGQETVTASQTIFASDPADSTPATVTIGNLANPLEITKPTNITGSISDTQAVISWTVSLYSTYDPDSSQTPIWTHSGTGPVNGTLATIDPTLMNNGAYTLDIRVLNAGGLVTDSVHNVLIAGKMKVGDVAFTLQDALVPMPGMDISVQRNYDSRNSAVSGDFGYGWQLGAQQIKIQQSRPINTGWEPYFTAVGSSAGGAATGNISLRPVDGRDLPIISVTLPDGTVETFQPKFNSVNGAAISGKFLIDGVPFTYSMQPTGNTDATFDIVGNHAVMLTDGRWANAVPTQDVDENGNVITNYSWIIPDQFSLTTKDGTTYRFSKSAGLQSITDLAGHSLTVAYNGIAHSNGTAISYSRDGLNRITKTTLPDGTHRAYSYDSQGNLASATSPVGVINYYIYDQPHHLISILDSNGAVLKGYSYDADGRLIGVSDALGNSVQMTHNLLANQEEVLDKLGHRTVYSYDDYGNVTRELDALGQVTTHTYNSNYDELSRTDANGNTTSWTYDSQHNKLSETDALGHTTTYTYSAAGLMLTQTDSSGRIVSNNTFDPQNRPTQLQDAAGNNTVIGYSNDGMTSLTDAMGNQTQYSYTNGNLTSSTDAAGKSTSYTYDGNNRKLSQTESYTDALGIQRNLVTTWVYDADGNVIQQLNPDGTSSTKTYDAYKDLLSDTDSFGRVTHYAYNTDHKLVQTTYADGTTSQTGYDANDNVISETDRLGRITLYAYDALGRKVKTTLPNGAVETLSYDPVGNIASETDANGNTTSYSYDALNRKIQTTNALGQTSSQAYDDLGRMTSSTDALGQTTQYSYDLLNHLIKTTYADHSSSQTSYDALGHKISVSNELGQTTQYSYDAMSHLIRVTDPLGNTTRYGYDQAGHKTSQTDALGRTTLWGYDPYGRVTSRTLPLGQSETYSYDAAGRLASHSDFNGQTTSYLYDSNDQLIKRTYADGSVDNLSLDNQGRLIASLHIIGNQGATTYYQYDNADHLIKETKPTNDTLSYQYDPQGNKTQLSVTASNRSNNGNQTYNYSYDALNRLISTSDNQGTTQEGYNPVGNKVIEILPNGITANYAYDLRNRLISIVYSTSSGIISRTGYVLDAMGKRLAMAEISTGLGRHSAWQYDGLNRLTQEQITDDATGATLHATKYTLDLVGNRTNQTKDSNSTDYVYDNNDRLISASNNGSISASYSYDNQGNTISTTKNGLTTNYSYNALNQLTQSGSTQYSYDIDGIRSSKTTAGISTTYITDHNRDYAQVVEESNGSSSTNYTYGDTLISSTGTSGSNTGTSYFLKDAQGSTKALANSNGTITDTYSYSAYGETSSKTGTTANNYLYAGEQYDQDLGQYYNRARYYNPSIGRFSQQDSYEGNNQEPASLHKYLYANNDPMMYTDPSGHDSEIELSIVANAEVGMFSSGGAASAVQPGRIVIGSLIRPIVSSAATSHVAGAAIAGLIYETATNYCQKNDNCELPMPIIFYGLGHFDLSRHILDSQVGNGSNNSPVTALLHRKQPANDRKWLRTVLVAPICPTPRAGKGDCDEYPFNSTEEGGESNYKLGGVSLRMINSSCNQIGGCYLGRMYDEDNTANEDPFLTVADPFFPLSFYMTRKGKFRLF